MSQINQLSLILCQEQEFCMSQMYPASFLIPPYHEREYYRDGLDCLDCPEDGEAEDLDAGEKVDAADGHMAKVNIVRLILLRHEDNKDALDELDARHGGNTHVEKHAI